MVIIKEYRDWTKLTEYYEQHSSKFFKTEKFMGHTAVTEHYNWLRTELSNCNIYANVTVTKAGNQGTGTLQSLLCGKLQRLVHCGTRAQSSNTKFPIDSGSSLRSTYTRKSSRSVCKSCWDRGLIVSRIRSIDFCVLRQRLFGRRQRR